VPGFVDAHSHVVPGVDDGAQTLEEGVEMVARARGTGTRLLFATPHVCPGLWLTRRRQALIERRFAELAEHAPGGIELRLGYEVTPAPARLRGGDDLERLTLDGTNVLLVDGPQRSPWSGDPHLLALIRRAVSLGLAPLVAHPERRVGWSGAPDRELALRLREAGAMLQIDTTGLSGQDAGPAGAEDARRLIAEGLCDVIASDAHGARWHRWPRLDEAHAEIAAAHGRELADRLCCGRALGLAKDAAAA
jgi:protein-tyrosine phosphatase